MTDGYQGTHHCPRCDTPPYLAWWPSCDGSCDDVEGDDECLTCGAQVVMTDAGWVHLPPWGEHEEPIRTASDERRQFYAGNFEPHRGGGQ